MTNDSSRQLSLHFGKHTKRKWFKQCTRGLLENHLANLVWMINCKLKLQCTSKKQFTLDNAVSQIPVCCTNV